MSEVLTARIGIDVDVVAELGRIPQTVIETLGVVLQAIEAIEQGTADDNALSGLLGALGGLADVVGEAPDLTPLLAPLGDLLGELPAEPIGDLTAITDRIAEVVRNLQPILDTVAAGRAEEAIREIVDRNIDLAGSLGAGASAEMTEIAGELRRFLELFGAMVGWRDQPPSAEEVARIVSNALVGVEPTLLAAPRQAVQEAIARLDALHPAGADVDRLTGIEAEVAAMLDALEGRLDVAPGAEIDWDAVAAQAALTEALLLDLQAVRDRVIAACITGLEHADLPDLQPVADALAAVPHVEPARLTPILGDLRRTLTAFIEGLTNLPPDAAALEDAVDQVVEEFFEGFAETGLVQLRLRIQGLQRRLLSAIEAIPLKDAAAEIERALDVATERLEGLDLVGLREAALQPIHDARATIETQAEAAIDEAIGALWAQVETALNEVSAQLVRLRDILTDASGQVSSFLDEVVGLLDQIDAAISEINAAIGSFDLEAPTDIVVGTLADIERTIAGLDLSVIPEAALAPLDAAAEALRAIDITAEVSGPIDDVLTTVDPTPALRQVSDALGEIFAELAKLDPTQAIGALDQPVDEVLSALARFGPEGLEALLNEALEPVSEAVEGLDFAELLAPVIDGQRQLLTRLDGVLDPALLMQPLEAAYRPILDAVDALEPTQYFGSVLDRGDRMGETLGDKAGPPPAVREAGTVLKDGIEETVDTTEDLFGFRPGDLLLPLIDMHRALMTALDAVDGSVLDDAAGQLQRGLTGALDATRPGRLAARLDQALDAVAAVCESRRMADRLAPLGGRHRLLVARMGIAVRAEGDLNIRARAQASLAITARIDPMLLLPEPRQAATLEDALARARRRLDLAPLASAHRRAERLLGPLLPVGLEAEGLNGGAVRAALQALDPAPLREEMNQLFDQFGERLVALAPALVAGLDRAARRVEELFLPVTPAALVGFLKELHTELRERVAAIGPAAFRDEIEPLFAAVKRQLEALDLGRLIAELNAERDALVQMLRDLVSGLLPDPASFRELQVRLAGLKPSRILAEVSVALADLSLRLEQLDPDRLFEPLIEMIARIRAQVPDAIQRIEEAFDAVLAAIPDGGTVSASAGGSASAGLGGQANVTV